MTLAKALLFERTLAEDVLHEVFVKLLGLQGRMRLESTLRGYLLRAVANQARTTNRVNARKVPVAASGSRNSHSGVEGPEDALERSERRQDVERALKKLPYRQREVVLLRHYGQLTFSAIAKAEGVSMSAVQARYRNGLKKLRSSLGTDL